MAGALGWSTGPPRAAPTSAAARVDPRPSATLIAALKQAHRLMDRHGLTSLAGAAPSAAKAPSNPYHRKLCRLARLAPDLQRAILDGRAPASLTLQDLVREPPPILWSDQAAWLARICEG